MAERSIFLSSSQVNGPLYFSDGGYVDLMIERSDINVYHTIFCYVVENGVRTSKRVLLTKEDGIRWIKGGTPGSGVVISTRVPLTAKYRVQLPESIGELFDFTKTCSVDFALYTYSNNSYSGDSIIGEYWFSTVLGGSTVPVSPSSKMYPQFVIEIIDETNAYDASGGRNFYLSDSSDVSQSSHGIIKVKRQYYKGHEPQTPPGAIPEITFSFKINGTEVREPFSDEGASYNKDATIGSVPFRNNNNYTVITGYIKDSQELETTINKTIAWTNSINIGQYNDLKETREDTQRYDYVLGKTPVPTSLYLDPDWLPNEYTTAPAPDNWEYFADINDSTTGLINQREILNNQKKELNLQLYRKYYKYIQEGTWLDDQYLDDDLYYLDANKILNQSSYPKATYTIDVVDIEGIPKYAAYAFNIGQRTYVEDPDMFGYTYNTVAGSEVKTPFKKEVIISERSRNFDDPSKSTIKVQTYKNQWEDIFSSLTATTQTLQYASGGYNRAANAINPNGALNVHSLEQTFQQGTFALSGSPTQSITWDAAYGIEITDLNNALVKLRIASNGLAISTDGGTTWNNAITGNGINTEYLLAGQIDAGKINITSAAGDYAFTWNENGLNAVLPDYEDSETGTQNGDAYVRFNDLGIYGTTEGSVIEAWEDSHPSADVEARIRFIKEHSNFLLTWDGLTLTSTDIDGNVISLNPNVGLEIFNNDTYTPPSSSPWLWNNTKLQGTTFNKDPQGNSYVAGDKIPVITLGEFYNGSDNQYGLLMRNSNGTPTLYTDENGNLTAISITANDITVDQGFLKRLYLENNSRISYLGSNKEDSQIQDNDVLISIGKTKNGDLYGPGKFIVRADGKYFGELAALNYVAAWDDNIEDDYENENTEPDQDAYAILLGQHDNGQSGSSRIGYIFSAFKSNTNAAQSIRVFDIRNDGTVDIAGDANISGNTSISGTTTIGGSTEIGGTTTLKDNLTLTGVLKVFGQQSPSGNTYLYLNGGTGQIGNANGTWSIDVTGYAVFNNANVTGTINATAGNFTGQVTVGTTGNPQVIIDGTNALIKSSNYQDGAGYGWKIDSNGDAVFNNITARGAIKTAVFEYAEIQAVGGIFLFRPSSTIKEAATQFVSTTDTTVDSTKTYYTRSGNNYTPVQNPSGNPRNKGYYEGNLVLKVEKPLLFAKITYNKVDTPSGNPNSQGWYEKTSYGYTQTADTSVVSGKDYYTKSETDTGSWCKISNYITDGASADSRVQNILLTNGLNYVYQIINVNTTTSEVTLSGAAEIVTGQNPVTTLEELKGGALVDMGRIDGSTNYGIGVNSSDNTVNLPARAISLFETDIDQTSNPKVSYNYQGILGTLPTLPTTQVYDDIYNDFMANKQGIYTNNMYIGDVSQYLAFYTDTNDSNKKKLVIKAKELMFEDNGAYIDVKDAIDAQNQHFWFLASSITGYPAGAYITNTDIEDFKTNRTGGYLLARSDGLEFGNGTTKFVDLIANRPGTTTGLYLYGSSSLDPDVSLTTDGLVVTKGRVYLPGAGITNEDYYPANYSGLDSNYKIRIWAGEDLEESSEESEEGIQIRKAKFIVTEGGYLYAQEGTFSGSITGAEISSSTVTTDNFSFASASISNDNYIEGRFDNVNGKHSLIICADSLLIHNDEDSEEYDVNIQDKFIDYDTQVSSLSTQLSSLSTNFSSLSTQLSIFSDNTNASIDNLTSNINKIYNYLSPVDNNTIISSHTGSVIIKILSNEVQIYNSITLQNIMRWYGDVSEGKQGNFTDSLQIGNFAFVSQTNGNLRLVKVN